MRHVMRSVPGRNSRPLSSGTGGRIQWNTHRRLFSVETTLHTAMRTQPLIDALLLLSYDKASNLPVDGVFATHKEDRGAGLKVFFSTFRESGLVSWRYLSDRCGGRAPAQDLPETA